MSGSCAQHSLFREDTSLFFFHIPKTAGTTVIKAFSEWLTYDETVLLERSRSVLNHVRHSVRGSCLDLPFLAGHFPLDITRHFKREHTKVFSFFREPVAHAISMFDYLQTSNSIARSHVLKEWIFTSDAQRLINIQTRWLLAQSRDAYLPGFDARFNSLDEALAAYTDESLLERAIEILDSKIDLVFAQHRMAEAQEIMEFEFGLPKRKIMPRLNAHPISAKSLTNEEVYAQILRMTTLDRRLFEHVQHRMDEQIKATREARRLTGGPIIDTKAIWVPGYNQAARGTPAFLDFTRPYWGESWHFREFGTEGGQMCWSAGTGCSIKIKCNDPGLICISYRHIHSVNVPASSNIRMFVDGEHVDGSITFYNPPELVFTSDVIPVDTPRTIEIQLHASEGGVPSEMGLNTDARDLGSCYSWIIVDYVV